MWKPLILTGLFLSFLSAAELPAFDVVSIHPQAPDDATFGVKMPSNGRFSATGVVAKLLVMLAYDAQESQIVGGPDWFANAKWDVQAVRDDAAAHSVEETRAMMQSMLADRFSLILHRSIEQRPAYVLTRAKNGKKLKAAEHDGATNVQISGNSIRLDLGEIGRLAQILSTSLGRPVIDRTGLTGRFDLSLLWDDAPVREGGVPGLDVSSAPGRDMGSIFTAIQDQLGLHLEAERVPVEVFNVDRIEKPSAN